MQQIGLNEKSNYKFNEVASLTGIKPYVLRFWESEFEHINPTTNQDGQKLYSSRDLVAIEKVKHLLFEDRLSIPQAKGYLDREMVQQETDFDEVPINVVEEVPEKTILVADAPIEAPILQLSKQSENLKMALDEIINRNSNSMMVPELTRTSETAQKQAINVISQWKMDNAYSEKDVVRIISAKKKMTNLLRKIDQIVEAHHWTL